MEEAWKGRAHLLFGGLLIVAGVVAPAVVAPATAAAAGGLFNALGGVGLTAIAGAIEQRSRRKLREPAVLLRNHDLQRLISLALEKALEFALQEPELKGRSREIKKLVKETPGYFAAFTSAPPEQLAQAALPSLVESNAAQQSALDSKAWVEVIEDLAIRAQVTSEIGGIKDQLAEHLGVYFERFVIEVFKEDATGRGPAEGRGWASLELLYWGLLRADLRGLDSQIEEGFNQQAEGMEKLAADQDAALRRVDAKLSQVLSWHGPGLLAEADDLRDLLRKINEGLGDRLDKIADLIGHGLLTPHDFESVYWRNRRDDPGAEELWSDPERAEVLTSTLVGREKELESFDQFLEGTSPRVLHLFGWPGAGKSRLMIAFARHAVDRGRRVFFVGPDVHDLGAALRRAAGPDPILLLWDNYRGRNQEAMRVFLGLDDLPGPIVKRAVTSWPTVNVLGDRAKDAQCRQDTLGQVVPEEALIAYTRRLRPEMSEDDARHVVRLAEGNPQVVLLALATLLRTEGMLAADLPRNLLENAYDGLIERAVRIPGLDPEDVRRSLLALALTGRVDYAETGQREAFESADVSAATLGELAKHNLVSRDENQAYALHLDSFRAHVVRRSLDHNRPEILSGNPEKTAAGAAPLIEKWIDALWGICVYATEGQQPAERRQPTALREPLQQALLAQIGQSNEDWDVERALMFGLRIANATAVEPEPKVRVELAERIAAVRSQHDTAEIALVEARALHNATVGEPEPKVRVELAERIAAVRSQHDTAEIALVEARALHNATVGEPEPKVRVELAERIAAVRSQHDTAEIALAEARALTKVMLGEPDEERQLELLRWIVQLCEGYDHAELAELHRLLLEILESDEEVGG